MKLCHCIRRDLGMVIVISEWSWHASRENNDVSRLCREAKSLLLPSTAELCNQELNAVPGQLRYNWSLTRSQKLAFAINWLSDTQKFFPNLQTSKETSLNLNSKGSHAPQEHKQTWNRLENYSRGVTFDWSRWEVSKVGVATPRSTDGRKVTSPETRVGPDRLGNCWCRQMNGQVKGVPLESPFSPLLPQKQ